MAKEVLITGINGFVGEHLAREFKDLGYSVTGAGHDSTPNEKVVDIVDKYVSCDLLDTDQVNSRLNLSATSAVVHLAGLANVGESFDQPKRYMTDNGLMAFNILQRAADDKMPGRVVVVSTGALYDPTQPLPLSETSKTNPNSPYAVGKLMTEDVTKYFKGRGVDAVIARPFNHIGPGQGKGFILPDFYGQLAASEGGKISVGNIDTKRDYTDVRDIVRAYGKLALAATLLHDTYNICSGASLSGREILDLLISSMGLDDVTVEVDPTKIRPNDIMDIRGDASRLEDEVGWKPEINLQQTIQDFVDAQAR